MSKRNNNELNVFENVFGSIDYEDDKNEYNEKLNQTKGFTYCGMYVTGTTIDQFAKLLEDCDWMIL